METRKYDPFMYGVHKLTIFQSLYETGTIEQSL